MKKAMRALILLVCLAVLRLCSSITDPQDVSVLRSLMGQWGNIPPSWGQTDDPCGTPWVGVTCEKNRITMLRLSNFGLKGTLSSDIGQLAELQSLDLSYNKDLSGTLSPSIGNLKKLTTLILSGCSFSGSIPTEIGSLPLLSFISLNSNKFSGSIPGTLGQLLNLYWLDLADNQLSGNLPISTQNEPGLDQLPHTKHFHFNKNKLTGPIPEELFSPHTSLIHLLLNDNKFSGVIPISLGFVKSLEVLRLDKNYLTGKIPSNISNLTNINELNLANNSLAGPLPDLTGMNSLNYVDLSNNKFDPSEIPPWFSNMESLTSLVIESSGLYGKVPEKLFGLPRLHQVMLKNNAFNGTLTLGDSVSQQLELIDLQNNALTALTLSPAYAKTLLLRGNPLCNSTLSTTVYCQPQQTSTPYSTDTPKCGNMTCSPNQGVSPLNCTCSYPYEGEMYFRAPQFTDLTNRTIFRLLETSLWSQLRLTPGAVSVQNAFFNSDSYLRMQLDLFPSDGMHFNRSEIMRIGSDLSNQTYKPPSMFGPYYFIASPYTFSDVGGN